jgi:hypothetical protein
MAKRIRKQVHELCASDFEDFPCWEYVGDEEEVDGQDECTIRPLSLKDGRAATGQIFVQAVFFFPNGRVRLGCATLNAGPDPSGTQPVLFLGNDSLMFYHGALKPGQSAVRSAVASLKSVCAIPFPIRYVTALSASDGAPLASGTLDGLYWLKDWRTGELVVIS